LILDHSKSSIVRKIDEYYDTMRSNFMNYGNYGIMPIVNAQNNVSSSQLQNATENTGAEKKTYVLIFGQRIVGNVDNSTKIVSSIVGENLVKNRRRAFGRD
jgi:hypothetical protein